MMAATYIVATGDRLKDAGAKAAPAAGGESPGQLDRQRIPDPVDGAGRRQPHRHQCDDPVRRVLAQRNALISQLGGEEGRHRHHTAPSGPLRPRHPRLDLAGDPRPAQILRGLRRALLHRHAGAFTSARPAPATSPRHCCRSPSWSRCRCARSPPPCLMWVGAGRAEAGRGDLHLCAALALAYSIIAGTKVAPSKQPDATLTRARLLEQLGQEATLASNSQICMLPSAAPATASSSSSAGSARAAAAASGCHYRRRASRSPTSPPICISDTSTQDKDAELMRFNGVESPAVRSDRAGRSARKGLGETQISVG